MVMTKVMRQKIPQQPAKVRIKNFFEVALGFSQEQAEKETSRCLQCKNPPCVKGCPVEIDIPAFIKLIKGGKRKGALELIKERNNLPAVCGRVCPQEDQCELSCILNKKKIPINIGALERYAADYEIGHKSQVTSHKLMCDHYSSVLRRAQHTSICAKRRWSALSI